MAIVGIDLGTTNSLVAAWTPGGPQLIENAIGETLTPSAVSIADDGTAIIGQAALDRLIAFPENSVASFKRLMGTSVVSTLAGKSFRAEELSALVLRALREDAEAKLGEPIEEAIVSVPAYFNDPQRKATLDAARLAGLNVQRLINEPTAAALAHGLEAGAEGRFLILDLGGGTFDVSLLHKFEGVMEVRASAGDSMLGGNDFRDAIVKLFSTRHSLDLDALPRGELAILTREAERLKRGLSENNVLEYDIAFASRKLGGKLARTEFEELVAPLERRLRAPIERAVNDARIDPAGIDQIVLVGGATRMPLVRNLAVRLFGRFPLIHPRPDHVIALGAAVQAGLKARHAALEDVIMTDVCPFTLGTQIHDPAMPEGVAFSPIIERNSIVPISRQQRYFTVENGQTVLRFEVLQGENLRPSRNIKIGEIVIYVPAGPKGTQAADVRYTYDINGALEVEITTVSTKVTERRVFRNQENMTEKELDARFASLAAIKLPPREHAENQALIARAERLYAESLGQAREVIRLLLDKFEAAINDPFLRENDKEQVRRNFAMNLAQFERSVF
jgi:molecular chaperone HscC